MDKGLYAKIYKAAYRLIRDSVRAQDITQEVAFYWLEYERRNQTKCKQSIDQAIIDACRKLYGSNRSECGKFRKQQMSELPEQLISEQDDPRTFKDYGIDLNRFSKQLDSVERAIFKLRIDEDWNENKIADYFGVSESRISQRLKGIQSRLSTYVKSQESRDKKEGEGKLEKVLSTQAIGNGWFMAKRALTQMARIQSFKMASFNETSFGKRAA